MGLDYHFYVQQRMNDRWVVPRGFTEADGFQKELGYFTWFDDKDVTIHRLFVGQNAIFPLRTELPPGIRETLLFERFEWAFGEWYQGWISFDALHIDIWDEYPVLISRPVPAHFAHLFVDGAQPFPKYQLLNAGCSLDEVAELENTSCARDIDFKPDGVDMVQIPIVPRRQAPEFIGTARVSWELTIAEFMGDRHVSAFQKLRELDEDGNLRVICTFS